MWDQLIIGYLAGIIEGEGTITFNKWNRQTPSPKIAVAMTDKDTIQRLYDVSGIGNLTGPFIRGNYQPIYKWTVYSNADVTRLLLAIAPIMSERRREKILEAAECLKIRSAFKKCVVCDRSYQGQPNQMYCSKPCHNKSSNDKRKTSR